MKNCRLHRFFPQKRDTALGEKKQIRQIILFALLPLLLATIMGCEAFVRKFTRKPKKEYQPQENLILVPEEYRGLQMAKDDLYRQHFLFWKSWQDELIASLTQNANHKKQISCIEEALKNLSSIRLLLNESGQKKLDIYTSQLNELKELIVKDLYGNNVTGNRLMAERIKRNILRDFSYNKISKDVIY